MNKSYLSIVASLLLILITFGEALSGGDEARRLIFIGTADLQGKLDPVERTVKLNNDGTSTNVIGGI